MTKDKIKQESKQEPKGLGLKEFSLEKIKFFKLFFIAIFLFVIFYASMPFLTLYNVKKAIEEKNITKFSENINYRYLKKSISIQVYDHLYDKNDQNLKKILIRTVAKDFIDKAIDEIVSEKSIFGFLIGEKKEKAKIFDMINKINIFKKKQVKQDIKTKAEEIKFGFKNHNRFFLRFKKDGDYFEIILTREKLSWKITEVILPKAIFKEKI